MLATDVNTILKATLKAINPYKLLLSLLNYKNANCLLVQGREYELHHNVKLIAAGKAVGGMVRAVQDILSEHITSGVISLPFGYKDTFDRDEHFYPLHSSMVSRIRYTKGAQTMPRGPHVARETIRCGPRIIRLFLLFIYTA